MPRTSSASEIPLPITYTPTTRRISKAKKGKRVHACEYSGCNKVFTRAEHRRRHELNHNPEALFRCAHSGCKKTFHRPDLLARHMERHEFEAQMNINQQWGRHTSTSITPPEQYIPRFGLIEPNSASYLSVTQLTNSMPIGSVKGPAIHPDVAVDSLLWNAVEMAPEHQTHIYPSSHIQESVEDSRFYSTPETCSSPSSDGTTLSIPSYPRSSVSSTAVTVIDSYPDPIIDSELTSSPGLMHATLRTWDQAESSLSSSNMVPLSISDNLIPSTIHYHPQSWPIPHHMSYDESFLPPLPYVTTMGQKSSSL